jgi:hypothetical protein
MDKLAELIDAARGLSPAERRKLIGELDALDRQESTASSSPEPLGALLAISGSVHADFSDISTDKYTHVAAASSDPKS